MKNCRPQSAKIGIDPDIDKSGYCLVIDKQIKDLTCLTFFQLLEKIHYYKTACANLTVYIEAGHLEKKSNWHAAVGRGIAEKIAKQVGKNHAVGILIEQFCKIKGIKYELIKPKKKIDSKTFCALTGIKKSNQETRDAAMLVI